MKQVWVILFYGVMYAAFHWWTDNTETGKNLKHFLQTWRADGWIHGIMCSITVFLFACAAILALGLALRGVNI